MPVRRSAPVIPIVYGTKSTKLPGKPDEPEGGRTEQESTHTWTVYVRCPCAKELPKVLKKVVFKLHESFDQPSRTCDQPPYEVTEKGWGEFEIQIKLYFVDAREKPISFFHLLKLYPNVEAGTTLEEGNSIISEFYDEVVFPNASHAMGKSCRVYLSHPKGSNDLVNGATSYAAMERDQIQCMANAEAKLSSIIAELRETQQTLLQEAAGNTKCRASETAETSNPKKAR